MAGIRRSARTLLRGHAGAPVRHIQSSFGEGIQGPLPILPHARGALGGWAPLHLHVDSRIVHGFSWVPVSTLKAHEQFIEERQSELMKYVESLRDQYTTVPAIIACSRSNVIIDGHHRTSVIKALNFELAPVVYIDYSHDDIQVNPTNDSVVTKQDVVSTAAGGRLLEPKSTAHVVCDGSGTPYPLICLSPICDLVRGQTGIAGPM